MILVTFLITVFLGRIILFFLKRHHLNQSLNRFLRIEHKAKAHTPTMGGLIFIIPSILIILFLLFFKFINFSYNLNLIILTYVFYMFIGFIDDFLIIRYHDNRGLTKDQKLFFQFLFALVFFYLYLKFDNEPVFWSHLFNFRVNLGPIYGIFILFILVGMSNAVNLTDGLDGLAGGLSIISLLAYLNIVNSSPWLEGYREISLFIQIVLGSLLGFLFYNKYPAKVFMGDTGSLALGALLASISILTKEEEMLLIICLPFIIETFSVIAQVIYFKLTKKRLFLMAPIHHHLEKKMVNEKHIVLVFYFVGLICLIISMVIR